MTHCFKIFPFVAAALLAGCDESVRLEYATKEDAESESVFAQGWLPEIIPPSSRRITMTNDLDLNKSEGEFRFEVSELDAFVRLLVRTRSEDIEGFSAYSYDDWIFWIRDSRDYCRFRMTLIPR